ncbi:MAG TPA: hypothetical protein VL093_03810 [Flavipsychrobacter sp.]|nr:hypothetical protein [Flavipsychrobacter sp.]
MVKRLDTQLEAAGAEFLVLGNLLIEKIASFKSYHNFKGYDIISTNPELNTSARIQVKSRYQTGWNGFIINNFDCDFVVLVALNRGYKKQKKNGESGIKSPDCYVFPISYIRNLEKERSQFGKISKSKLSDLDSYKNRWDLIATFLSQ